MDGLPYADIIILALIAGFILLRLRSVLGQKSGNDNPQFFRRPDPDAEAKKEPVVQVAERKSRRDETDTYLYRLKDEAIAGTIAEIKKIDPSFTATNFLSGARMAYEMVFDAFAKGDRKTLEMLLNKPIYEDFTRALEERTGDGKKIESTLVAVHARDITAATLVGNMARLSVKFDSEQVTLVKNDKGEIIEGDASHTHLMDDEWTFERDVSSKNPNWKIIET